jgi:hypothetical protein
MSVSALRTTATFAQLDVRIGTSSVVVDLVADPTPIAEAAQPFAVGNATILVETPHQLLVNKLCARLSRSELRDLVDVRVLIESGLDRARPCRLPRPACRLLATDLRLERASPGHPPRRRCSGLAGHADRRARALPRRSRRSRHRRLTARHPDVNINAISQAIDS